MTRLCVSIRVESADRALAQAAVAAERGADLVEFRIDRFTDDPAGLDRLIDKAPLPCIVTCRPTWEGGAYDGDESDRLATLKRAAQKQPAYLDVELSAFEESDACRRTIEPLIDHPGQRQPTATGLILSSHDFQSRPADLTVRFNRMAEQPAARVVKIAWRARSLRDNIEAFELLRSGVKPTVALCMGEFGLASRVLAKKFGAWLTFAGLNDATVTAPGQVGIETIKHLYRWDSINEATRVYGVIGWPIGHSLSPHIHNAGFARCGENAIYLPLPIPDDYVHFKATVGAWLDFKPLDFAGASVTIPHKHHLLRFVRESGGQVDPLAEAIGAANTLTVRSDGSLTASNTDCRAVIDSVCAAMGIDRSEMARLPVAVIGAGGAARAAVAAFAEAGAAVTVYNRTLKKAEQLAERFTGLFGGHVIARPLHALAENTSAVCINCTSLGMSPHVESCALERLPAAWGEQTVVFDTVYNPLRTRLLAMAQDAGCITISGVEMFVRQAADQFTQWTGEPAPIDLFRQIVLEQLGQAS